jgi:2-dehydro-3-deoxyphosphogluconate aldolase/(4S)-4-hydroxy-2-oxoglutarate aldolase
VTAALPRGIVGVIRTPRPDHALTLARGWLRAGVPGVEITLTVPDAESVIAEVAGEGGTRVGAGTVLDPARVAGCVAAGASYVVAPDTSAEVIAEAVRLGVPAVPGAMTPTEMAAAVRLGATAVKLFPASLVGGAAFVRAVLEPMPHLSVVASGGVRVEQVRDYLEAGATAVCLGRELILPDAVERGDVDAVAEFAAGVLERSGIAAVHA